MTTATRRPASRATEATATASPSTSLAERAATLRGLGWTEREADWLALLRNPRKRPMPIPSERRPDGVSARNRVAAL